MDTCGRSDHGVLYQLVRFPIHEATPFPEARRIHWEDLVRGGQLVYPTLDLVRFRWILMSCPLDPRLQFAHRDRRKEQLLLFLEAESADYCTVRVRFS